MGTLFCHECKVSGGKKIEYLDLPHKVVRESKFLIQKIITIPIFLLSTAGPVSRLRLKPVPPHRVRIRINTFINNDMHQISYQ